MADIPLEVVRLHRDYVVIYGELEDGSTRSPLSDAPEWCVQFAIMTLEARAERRRLDDDTKRQREIVGGLCGQ